MPIRGLTDQAPAAFPRIGVLRKGDEAPRDDKGNIRKPGQDLPHFRFTSERPEVMAAFQEAYGEQPAQITVFLPYATVDEAFSTWKEKWVAGGLVHRCDGQTMTIWLGTDGKYYRTPKLCDGGCDEVGRLSVWIPELITAGFVGFVIFQTHSLNDLLSIQGSLLAALATRGSNPWGLKGIQWVLRRVKERISTPLGNGKRARRDKWLVKLEPAADWVQLQLQAAHNATMMLPAPIRDSIQRQDTDIVPVDPQTGEIVEGTATTIRETTAASQPTSVTETRTVQPEQQAAKPAGDRKTTAAQTTTSPVETVETWLEGIEAAQDMDTLAAVWAESRKFRGLKTTRAEQLLTLTEAKDIRKQELDEQKRIEQDRIVAEQAAAVSEAEAGEAAF